LLLRQGFQDVSRVALGLDLWPGPRDATLGIDEERRSGGAPVLLPVPVLLDPRAIGVGDIVLGVGEEREGESELLAERPLAGGALRTDAPDIRAALDDRVVRVAELAGLDGAAGRVVLGIEVEDRPATALVGKAMDRPCFVG
jgi:hypothetical protein